MRGRINVLVLSGTVGDGPFQSEIPDETVFRMDQATDAPADPILSLSIVGRGPQAAYAQERLKRGSQVVVQGQLIPWYGGTVAVVAERIKLVTG